MITCTNLNDLKLRFVLRDDAIHARCDLLKPNYSQIPAPGPPGGPEVNEPRSYALGMPASAGHFQQSVIRMISILEINISFKQIKINIRHQNHTFRIQ
ncbi:unnamed protein product [Phytophthora lilii]|uniref:Unnamed protein product n=1 Tax=Phytophthora lilii TaxID=2077276 RepID=A0A9W6WQQ6_9STRA|nr:unnamed protein product [Phytophthora lilii]